MYSKSGEGPLLGADEIRGPAFRRSLDAVPTALVITDPNGVIDFINSAAESLFLYERNRLQGQPVELLVPVARRSGHSARLASFLWKPAHRSMGLGMEISALRSDGTEFPAEIGLNPLPTAEGTWVMASIVDLTEWKRLAVKVQEQGERIQAYWEAASEGLITVGESGNIEMVNKAAERIFGYDRSELMGKPIEMVIPENLVLSHKVKREHYFANPAMRPMGVEQALFGRRKDGTLFPVEVGLNVARIGDQTVAIGFVTDISEKRRLQDQATVLGALVDLQQELSTRGRAASPSRDSDPLTGLDTRAMFDLAIEKASADPRGLHVVVYSVQRMEQMRARFGAKTAERIVVFASQYIANTLLDEDDRLFQWNTETFVSLVRRDSSPAVQREAAEACGNKLEFFEERVGGSSMVKIALTVKVLSIAEKQVSEVISEIEQLVRSGHK